MKLTNILVPLAGTAIDPDVIEYAIALGKAHKAKITAVHVIEVKWNMPLDAVLDAELERGEEILAHAEQVAEKLGAHLETEVLQARMPYRKRLGRVYVGRTVEDVYVKAPCAVLAYRQEEPK